MSAISRSLARISDLVRDDQQHKYGGAQSNDNVSQLLVRQGAGGEVLLNLIGLFGQLRQLLWRKCGDRLIDLHVVDFAGFQSGAGLVSSKKRTNLVEVFLPDLRRCDNGLTQLSRRDRSLSRYKLRNQQSND